MSKLHSLDYVVFNVNAEFLGSFVGESLVGVTVLVQSVFRFTLIRLYNKKVDGDQVQHVVLIFKSRIVTF